MEEPILNNSPELNQLNNGICTAESEALAKTLLNANYKAIVDVIGQYMDMPEDYVKFIAIWIIGTYFHDSFNTFPYLFFNAMRGSGKTRTLKLVSSLGANGDGSIQNNLTEAVLFRIPKGTTTCIDEVEQIGNKEKQTLRELLNSAYKKGMKVKRMRKAHTKEGEMQITETFEPYFPICMANIWGVEEVLGDRSIVLVLEKSNNPAITKMVEDFDTNTQIQAIKRTLSKISVVSVVKLRKKNYIQAWNNYIKSKYTTTLTTYTTLNYTNYTEEEKRKNMLEEMEMLEFFNKIDSLGISGRNFELLFPLLLTAEQIGDEVFEDILRIGSDIVNSKKEDEYTESKDVSLIDFVSTQSSTLNYKSVKSLAMEFRKFLGDVEDEDRWLNDKWLGRALKRLNLITYKKRTNQGMFVSLDIVKAIEKLKIFKKENEGDDK